MKLDPSLFGYCDDGGWIPAKIVNLYPSTDDLVPCCCCKKCTRKQCRCRAAGLPCIRFCKCVITSTCENPLNKTT